MTNIPLTTPKTITTTSTNYSSKPSSYSPCERPFSDCIDETEVFTAIVDAGEIDIESKKMFESNEKRLKFLEQEVIRLSEALNPSVLVGDDNLQNKM